MFKMLRKNRKGFTLIELIVVIAILGILALIAIPRLGGFTESAKIAADEQLEVQIKNAILIAVASGELKAGTYIVVNDNHNPGKFIITGTGVLGDNAPAKIGEVNNTVQLLINDKVDTSTGFQVNTQSRTYEVNSLGEVTVKNTPSAGN